LPEAAAAKLDQIKDLYLTAEAIGENALDKHFDQVSERQRALIREFFERSEPGGTGTR
jgi:Tat protein secretion system quality control protein TatD with DNase activity